MTVVTQSHTRSSVVFSNIKLGPIGSKVSPDGSGSEPNSPTLEHDDSPSPGGTGAPHYGQCGGNGVCRWCVGGCRDGENG
ncbi:hypothetical protein VUR80DRAFT_10115 [Thermomyces stellatus]